MLLQAATKAKISEMNAALKQKQKEIGFQMDQQRQNLSLIGELKREEMLNRQQMINDGFSKVVEIIRELRTPPKESSGQG